MNFKNLGFFLMGFAVGSSSQAHAHCNQRIFDKLYAEIVQINLRLNVNKLVKTNESTWQSQQEALTAREDTPPDLSILRELCFGQLSTFERGKR